MQRATIGGLCAVILLLLVIERRTTEAQPTRGPGSAGPGLVSFTAELANGVTMLTVIEPAARVMAVYHLDPAGKIMLRSVRQLNWDLQLEEFNGASPLPREIQTLLGRR